MQGADVTVVQPGADALVSQFILGGYALDQFTPATLSPRTRVSWDPQSGAATLSLLRPWAAASYAGAVGMTPGAAVTVAYAWGPPGSTVMDGSGHSAGEERSSPRPARAHALRARPLPPPPSPAQAQLA